VHWKPRIQTTAEVDFFENPPWIFLAIAAPIVLWILLRWWVLPWMRKMRLQLFKYSNTVPIQKKWSAGFKWTIRAFFCISIVIVATPPIRFLWNLHRIEKQEECSASAAACLNPETGLIGSVARLKTGRIDGSEAAAIACRFVGKWSSVGVRIKRIQLFDDGRYLMEGGLKGHWAVQGPNLLWQSEQLNGGEPDVNHILEEDNPRKGSWTGLRVLFLKVLARRKSPA
jgi:hypothetical protein